MQLEYDYDLGKDYKMTLIYVHHDQASNCFEVFSDSVISSGQQQITDIFPKINILNIRSRSEVDGSFIQDTQLGFAFAGSTLSAHAVLASAAAFLQNLASSNNAIISIDDACRLISKIAFTQIKKIAELRVNPQESFIKIAITGFCPILNKVVAYTISSEIVGQEFSVSLTEVRPIRSQSPNQENSFGSGTKEFIEYAQNHQELGAFEMFSSFLKQCDRTDVGGYVQYGISHAQGFEICPTVETLKQNDSDIPLNFRQLAGIGLDTDNLMASPEEEGDRVVVGRLFRGSLSRV